MADEQLAPAAPVQSPLAPFKGEKSPAPAWFDWALAQEPERSFVPVDGANIELLTWGERGKPGLLLIHGNSANADWNGGAATAVLSALRPFALNLQTGEFKPGAAEGELATLAGRLPEKDNAGAGWPFLGKCCD